MKDKKRTTDEVEQPAAEALATKRQLVDLLDLVHSKPPSVTEEEAD